MYFSYITSLPLYQTEKVKFSRNHLKYENNLKTSIYIHIEIT